MITLRNTTESDLHAFFEHEREPEASAMARFPARDEATFFRHWRTKVLANPTANLRTIVVDGETAGYVTSWGQEDGRFVAYWIGKAFWGRGVASAALAEFLRAHERARPLFAHVVTTNGASRRVLQKCGFSVVSESNASSDGVVELTMTLAT